jgi:predicted nuclease of predicted toxin-antitoxin system
VTKDADYNNLSVVRGCPPKVIWLLVGNCTTAQVEAIFRSDVTEIRAFGSQVAVGTFALSWPS